MDGPKLRKVADVEVPAGERTPLVDRLLRVIEEQQAEIRALRDEITRLKGLPRWPTIRPSTLNAPHPDPSHKKRRRGKRPGSAKRQKTGELMIHENVPVPLEGVPEGTQQNGYEDFVVQDLKIEAHTTTQSKSRVNCVLPAGVRDQSRPRKQRHTAQRIYERLRDEHGYAGSASSVRRYVAWRKRGQGEVFMPLCFGPGEEASLLHTSRP